MKPPICVICHKRLSAESGDGPKGGLVKFKDFQQLPHGKVGHPKGLSWFCGQHFESAFLLKDCRQADAIRQIKSLL